MGRRKKNFEKVYDLGDFSLEIDTYKKQVLFFQMSFFGWKEDSTILDLTEAKKEVLNALKATYKDIKAERRIYDLLMGDISKGKNISVKLFFGFYIKNRDEITNIEKEIIENSTILMKKIKKILNKYAFNKFTKPQRKRRV